MVLSGLPPTRTEIREYLMQNPLTTRNKFEYESGLTYVTPNPSEQCSSLEKGSRLSSQPYCFSSGCLHMNQVSSICLDFESIQTGKASFSQLDLTLKKELRWFQEHTNDTVVWDLFPSVAHILKSRFSEYSCSRRLGHLRNSGNSIIPANPP